MLYLYYHTNMPFADFHFMENHLLSYDITLSDEWFRIIECLELGKDILCEFLLYARSETDTSPNHSHIIIRGNQVTIWTYNRHS